MDLSTLDTTAVSEIGAKMEVQHPGTGAVVMQEDNKPVTITLAGQDSDLYRKADRRITDKRLKNSAGARRTVLTSEGIEADNLERLVACTIAWDGLTFEGSTPDCTPENARALYKKLFWLREQAEAFIAERANFLKA